MYFISMHLLRVHGLSCGGGVGTYCVLMREASHDGESASGVSTGSSSWDMSVGWFIGIVVEEAE